MKEFIMKHKKPIIIGTAVLAVLVAWATLSVTKTANADEAIDMFAYTCLKTGRKPIVKEITFLTESAETNLKWGTPAKITLGQEVKISGYLRLKNSPHTGIVNQFVDLTAFLPETSETITFRVQTNRDGYFEQPVLADQVGIWELTVNWLGNRNYQKSNNHLQLSVVLPSKKPELVGDTNGDGLTNIFDLVMVAGQFGATGPNLAGNINIQNSI